MNRPKYDRPAKCPECSWDFKESKTQWGVLRQCTGCTVRQWIGLDGEAMGSPANAYTRRFRMRAHASFDRLWRDGPLGRVGAYAWLAGELGLAEVHIGELSTEQCDKVVTLSDAKWLEIQNEVRRNAS